MSTQPAGSVRDTVARDDVGVAITCFVDVLLCTGGEERNHGPLD